MTTKVVQVPVELSHNDEALVEEVAFAVRLATKQDPTMDGRCHRVHDENEARRIARAAIRACARYQRGNR